jgi:hypothetical protein
MILNHGHFIPASSHRRIILVSDLTSIEMLFDEESFVTRLLHYHGKDKPDSTFGFVKMDGLWKVKGFDINANVNPVSRPFSNQFDQIQDERSVSNISLDQTRVTVFDGMELLRKASQSSSSLASPSSKAQVGKVSLKTTLTFDKRDPVHKRIEHEMSINSFVMDKLRYSQLMAQVFENMISRLVVSMEGNKLPKDLEVESRCITESSLEVLSFLISRSKFKFLLHRRKRYSFLIHQVEQETLLYHHYPKSSRI